MTEEVIYIPFPRKLYDDLIRYSKLDPVDLAPERILMLIEQNLDSMGFDWFGENLLDFVRVHLPAYAKTIAADEIPDPWGLRKRAEKDLIWKELTIPAGTMVRMQYVGTHHFAEVKDGKIEDGDGRYSPSEWASKVASGTSRNAWRDLWFKLASKKVWVPADQLRAQATASSDSEEQ